jgi:hypothetical protein
VAGLCSLTFRQRKSLSPNIYCTLSPTLTQILYRYTVIHIVTYTLDSVNLTVLLGLAVSFLCRAAADAAAAATAAATATAAAATKSAATVTAASAATAAAATTAAATAAAASA